MNKYLVIIGLFLDVGIIVFFSFAENHFNVGGVIIGFLFLIIDLIRTIKFYKNYNKFEYMKKQNDKLYYKLLNNVDKAEKELEKFYINHSEYKMEEMKND